VERRKAWRMLQSKAGIENREYKAQRAVLADVDACRISKADLFARAEELMKERMPKPAAAHKPAEPRATATGPAIPPAAPLPPAAATQPGGGATA
jgi:hypothetical protein